MPSCAEGGVLGVLPGIIGTIQATETIKLILGTGEPLIGRFLIYDALRMRFRELKLRKDPDCPVCGTHPTVTELIDYEQFCGVAPHQVEAAKPATTSADDDDRARAEGELDRGETDRQIVDVREPQEYQINRIPGSMLIPLGELAAALRRARPERRHRLPVQVGHAERQGARSFCGRSGSRTSGT